MLIPSYQVDSLGAGVQLTVKSLVSHVVLLADILNDLSLVRNILASKFREVKIIDF